LEKINNYAVYYGSGRIEELKKFDMVIIQPESYTADEVGHIRQSGTLVFAYLSVGEAEPYRWWFELIRDDWILEKNPNWNSLYVDAGKAGWRSVLTNKVLPKMLQKPFDGLFLDTLDTVDVYPDTFSGMVRLIKEIHAKYPGKLLIQNRGFSLFDRTASLVDGIMYEDFRSTYDFSKKEYRLHDLYDTAYSVKERARRNNTVTLSLDYVDPDNKAVIEECISSARELGYIPYISTIELTGIYTFTR